MPTSFFLHIQKTAGTSIVSAVSRLYDSKVPSHGDCWGKEPSDFSAMPFVSGHVGFHYASQLMDRRDFNFTFLRNPFDRILSLYYFCRSRNPKEYSIYEKANQLTLDQFLAMGHRDPWIKKNIYNNQVWQLAHGYAHLDNRTINHFSDTELLDLAFIHISQFHFVGITENFATDGREVFQKLGISQLFSLPHLNSTLDRPSLTEHSQEVKDRLHSLTQLDWQLYRFILSKRSLLQ